MKDLVLFHDRLDWLPVDAKESNPHPLSGLWLCPDYSPERDTLCVRVGRSRLPCHCRLKGRLSDGRAILLFSVKIRTRLGVKWLRFCRETADGGSRVITRRLLLMPAASDRIEPAAVRAEVLPARDEDAFLAMQPVPVAGPLVSVLMPVFNPPIDCLGRAVASVLAQTYTRWELCIADDASDDPAVAPFLRRLAAADPRIKILARPVNGHISAATNSALSLASGEWCALLDQDDELSPHVLAAFIRALAARPDAEMAYTDEDKIDAHGRRHGAYRKPGWMPELLFGQNFVSHLGIYRTERLRAIGGFREGFEGCQDWDMTLRFTHGLAPERILHIPFILYHWRMLPHSTASAVDAKPYVVAAAERTVTSALAARNVTARLSPLTPAQFRIEFVAPELPSVALVGLPSPDERRRLSEATDYAPLSWAAETFSVSLLGELISCARTTDADILVILPPCYFPRRADWLRRLAGALLIPGVVAAGGAVIGPRRVIVDGCLALDALHRPVPMFDEHAETATGYFGRAQLLCNPDGLGLHGLAVRRAALLSLGAFKTSHLIDPRAAGWELCSRLRAAGGRLVYDPGVLIDHAADPVPLYRGEGLAVRHLLATIRPVT